MFNMIYLPGKTQKETVKPMESRKRVLIIQDKTYIDFT